MLLNLPNKLTLLRIILIPFFMGFVLLGDNLGMIGQLPVAHLVATVIFIAASITDWLDGHLARKWNLVTNFGKFADPMADKVLVMTALILLVGAEQAPAWVVAIIVARELAVTGLRLLLVEEGGTVLAAAWPGKIKTATQMLAIILLLVHDYPFQSLSMSIGTILLYISLFFTVYSGIDYFYHARFLFQGTLDK